MPAVMRAGAHARGRSPESSLLPQYAKPKSPASLQKPSKMQHFPLTGARMPSMSRQKRIVMVFAALLFFVFCAVAFLPLAPDRSACDVDRDLQFQLGKSEKVLPKIIHQQWKTENIDGKSQAAWHAAWKKLFPEPEWKHMLWTDENARAMIRDHFPHFLKQYDSYPHGIQRADAARYFLLWLHGGVYADMDYEPLVNFWSHLPKTSVGLIESPYQYNEKVQNSLMSSPPRHPFWNFTFDALVDNFVHADSILESTGPSMLDKAVEASEAAYANEKETPFTVLPCENYQRVPLGKAGWDSPFLSFLVREIIGRTPLVKACGSMSDNECHFGIHHNTVTYMKWGIFARGGGK